MPSRARIWSLVAYKKRSDISLYNISKFPCLTDHVDVGTALICDVFMHGSRYGSCVGLRVSNKRFKVSPFFFWYMKPMWGSYDEVRQRLQPRWKNKCTNGFEYHARSMIQLGTARYKGLRNDLILYWRLILIKVTHSVHYRNSYGSSRVDRQ